MKKYLFAFIVTLLALILFSCSKENSEYSTEDNITLTSNNIVLTSNIGTVTDNTSVSETEGAEVTTAEVTEDLSFYKDLAKSNLQKSLEIGKSTVDNYVKISNMKLVLSEKLSINGTSYRPIGGASVWHYTSFYAMTSRLARLLENSENKSYFEDINDKAYKNFSFYKGTADVVTYSTTMPMTLYSVNRASTLNNAIVSGDKAVYDDQMWIIREFVYSYKTTQNREYLDEAMRLSKLCIAGWDTTLKSNGEEYGGITWGPSYSTKHTCSNGPIIAPLVEIYEILKEEGNAEADYYLDWAKKIYAFAYKNLKNGNFTFGDLIGSSRSTVVENGIAHYVTRSQGPGIDSTAYTYNTGSMISGAAALYRATGDQNYYKQAKNCADGAYRTFCKKYKNENSYLWCTKFANNKLTNDSQTIWFNLVLLEGFIELAPYYSKCEEYILTFQSSLDYAYEHYNKDGLLPRNFIEGWDESSDFDKNKNVMDQASASQMYSMIAEWALGVIENAENK